MKNKIRAKSLSASAVKYEHYFIRMFLEDSVSVTTRYDDDVTYHLAR